MLAIFLGRQHYAKLFNNTQYRRNMVGLGMAALTSPVSIVRVGRY